MKLVYRTRAGLAEIIQGSWCRPCASVRQQLGIPEDVSDRTLVP
jgi:hypothetical protein